MKAIAKTSAVLRWNKGGTPLQKALSSAQFPARSAFSLSSLHLALRINKRLLPTQRLRHYTAGKPSEMMR